MSGSRPPASSWRELRYEGIGFTHPRADDDPLAPPATLDNVTTSLVRGRRYALIGPSGSGKTTLLRVLAGLYEPASGVVRIDGTEVPPAQVSATLRELVTLLPQDAELFGGTVRENLLLARRGSRPASEEERDLAEALSIAQARDFVVRMPAGMESVVAARGGNLSGGQRQRLAIARALLAAANSSVLLLDEPTSALDPGTEAALIGALLDARKDAALVASIHRPQLLAAFDEVIVVNAGRVVAQGTVADLSPRSAELQAFLRMGQRHA